MAAGHHTVLCVAVLLAAVGLAAAAAAPRRLLAERDWGDTGDPSGTQVLSRARTMDPPGGPDMARLAVTPEAAEAMSNSHYMGLFKNELGQGGHKPTATYAMLPATVEADRAFSDNPANRKQVVQPRAQSAIDTPYKSADLYSGSAQMPTVATGSVAAAQSFEGATAVSASDAVWVNGGAKRPGRDHTTSAHNMLVTYTPNIPRASKAGSFGVTAQTANSIALAGASNGKLTMAQSEFTAAIAQASRSSADQWKTAQDDGKKWERKWPTRK